MRSTLATLGCIALVTVAMPSVLSSQAARQNVAYVELLGSGGVASVNLEVGTDALRMRAGIGRWTSGDLFGAGSTTFFTVPLTLSHVRGDGNHHLESGGGVTFGRENFTSAFDGSSRRSRFTTLTALVGYRYQRPGASVIFRAMLTPLYGLGKEEDAYPSRGLTPSIGISLGAAF